MPTEGFIRPGCFGTPRRVKDTRCTASLLQPISLSHNKLNTNPHADRPRNTDTQTFPQRVTGAYS
ncbi:hypothetical protein I540_5588 [Mycobacteroides abscessus subsp. bolletii 1513]|uniref:Uncharacterized protein n=1 Tax=Mycobacteroides abscessus subsp. bolletii 1513 TaxID=1299321 RepID=X8DI31_9MYCO|nr:hypothetical protein I540_5588 [Mycobacteroides abscessus subsp. bolletii 1513]